MQKPDILYHASPNSEITIFEPRNETPRYEAEENLVFATPHKAVAAMFLSPRSIASEIAQYGDQHVIFINANQEEYEKQDTGGAIYVLPADTFTTDATVGMKEVEWTSPVSVVPLSSQSYQTATRAMLENNVQMYFVSDDQFHRIKADPANALDVVRGN